MIAKTNLCFAPRCCGALLLAGLGFMLQMDSAVLAGDVRPSVEAAASEVFEVTHWYNAVFDPAVSIPDEIDIIDGLRYWRADRNTPRQSDPPTRHEMLVFTFDASQISPDFADNTPLFFYDVVGEGTVPAGFVAYAPARSSAEATEVVPTRVHAWSGAVLSGENLLDTTRPVRKALELGLDSFEIVVYTSSPIRLLADADPESSDADPVLPTTPAILVLPHNALQFLADDEPQAAGQDGAVAGGTTCRSCSDGGLSVSFCAPTQQCCGSTSELTYQISGVRNDSGLLRMWIWEDDLFPLPNDLVCSWTRNTTANNSNSFTHSFTCNRDLCDFEAPSLGNPEVFAEFVHEEDGFDPDCSTSQIEVTRGDSSCGNNICESTCGETASNCCQDCATCCSNSDCNDGQFCNGAETCSSGSCQSGSNPCSGSTPFCNEGADRCDECISSGHCDDGQFCNGAETCSNGNCQSGSNPCSGSTPFCNEGANRCDECTSNGHCDDGQFCNGAETCSNGTCQSGSNPCSGSTPICNEGADRCDACDSNDDCDDNQFCNGTETCSNGTCQSGSNPCSGATPICNEGADRCDACDSNDDCDDNQFCNGAETCSNGTCQSGSNPCSGATPYCAEHADRCDECETDAHCVDDQAFCNGPETCDNGSCASGPPPCPANNCDEAANLCCDNPPCDCVSDSECDDGNYCNGEEVCQGGNCIDGNDPCLAPPLECCNEVTNTCDDCDGPCDNSCGNGTCEPNCDEDCNTCSSDCGCDSCEECIGAVCQDVCGNALCEPTCGETRTTCPDDCACTNDSDCNGNLCEECENGECRSECDNDEICVSGACVADPCAGVDCNDGNPCTQDECVGGSCDNTPECSSDSQCDDAKQCTSDTCVNGCCTYNPPVCSDDPGQTVPVDAGLDADKDGIIDTADNCPATFNPLQRDCDADDEGDACDASSDCDGDGVGDVDDNCLGMTNTSQVDEDNDGFGDACDNCPSTANLDQADCDDDGIGNTCDDDMRDCNQTLAVSGPDRLSPNNVGCYILALDGDPVAFTATNDCGSLLVPEVTTPLHVCFVGPDVDMTTCMFSADQDSSTDTASKEITIGEGGNPPPPNGTCGACGTGAGLGMIMAVFGWLCLRFVGPGRRTRTGGSE